MHADAEIVGAVLGGYREAFAALVSRYERTVWATARRVLRDDHVAADAAQEAFLQAFHRSNRQPSDPHDNSSGRTARWRRQRSRASEQAFRARRTHQAERSGQREDVLATAGDIGRA